MISHISGYPKFVKNTAGWPLKSGLLGISKKFQDYSVRGLRGTEKNILTTFQATLIFHFLEKKRQFVNDKLALTFYLFQVKKKSG